MRLLSHFPAIGVSNTYVVGPEDGGDAILVDPGRFDVTLLELIEGAGFYIRTVLVTHDHWNHIQGLRTLMKIYEAEIIAGDNHVDRFSARPVAGGSRVKTACCDIEVMEAKGHSADSRVYKVGSYLFTGDVLSAGRIGTSPDRDSGRLLQRAIRTELMTLPEDTLVLPGHGPPTSIAIEKRLNPDLNIPD